MTPEEIEAMKAENAKFKSEAEKAKTENDAKAKEEADRKAKEEADKGKDFSKQFDDKRKEEEKTKNWEKEIESSALFNSGLTAFLKDSGKLISPSIAGVVEIASKESYKDSIEKARGLKDVIVKEFFKVQSNLDHLTQSQRSKLDQFLDMTKNGRAEQVTQIYDELFEPTLSLVRKIEGYKVRSDGKSKNSEENGIKSKLIEVGKKSYLKGK